MENYKQQERYKSATKTVKKMKSFYIHLAIYLVLNIYMGIHAFARDGVDGLVYSLLGFGLFWGIGLFFHWYGVFGKNLLFNKDWEEKKIKELMNKDQF